MPTAEKRNPLFGLKARKMRPGADQFQAAIREVAKTSESMRGLAPGQRLFFWIGQAAKAVREDAGLSLEKVAAELGSSKEKLSRFEKGYTKPQVIEEVLVVYAKLASIADPRDIIATGVRLWYEHGEPPQSNDEP